MTVDQIALMPPSISGVSTSPTPGKEYIVNQLDKGQDPSPSTDISFSPEAMQLYDSFVGGAGPTPGA